jgi:excisionase family DNA binding protein
MPNSTLFVTMPLEEFKKYIYDIVKNVFTEFHQPLTAKDSDEIMTIEDVAKFLTTSEVTIHKWKKQKKIPFYRIGRRVYFKKNEIVLAMNSSQLKKK